MSRERHGWLLSQLPTALAQPPPSTGTVRYLDMPGFMSVFEEIANSIDDQICALPYYFDRRTSPLDFARWMGRWLAVDISPTLPMDKQRELLRAAGEALPWRGTAKGLSMVIEAFTGVVPHIEESGAVLGPGDTSAEHKVVEVTVSSSGALDELQLLRLIRDEIPADAALRLSVAGHFVDGEFEHPDDAEAPEERHED